MMINDDYFSFPASLFVFPGVNNCLALLVLYYYCFNSKLFSSGLNFLHIFRHMRYWFISLENFSHSLLDHLPWASAHSLLLLPVLVLYFLYPKSSFFLIYSCFSRVLPPIPSWERVYGKWIIWDLDCCFFFLEVYRIFSFCSQCSEMSWCWALSMWNLVPFSSGKCPWIILMCLPLFSVLFALSGIYYSDIGSPGLALQCSYFLFSGSHHFLDEPLSSNPFIESFSFLLWYF